MSFFLFPYAFAYDDAVNLVFLSCICYLLKVEHCWQEYHKGKTTTVFEEKLMEELKAPFCEEEYKRLLHIITVRKPVQRHRDLRGGIIIYDEPRLGKSYLDCNVGK